MIGQDEAVAEFLRQADLSDRDIGEMSAVERAELDRRYARFTNHFRATDPVAAAKAPRVRRMRQWHP